MTCVLRPGHRTWGGSRDSEGHRTYTIQYLIACDTTDGPANVLRTPGLPLPGSIWLVDGDTDVYAWCRPEAKLQVHQEKEGEPSRYWTAEFTFSTKPLDRKSQRCNEIQIEDPILEPPKISGSFQKFSEEATHDRYGLPIINSSWEQIRGPQVEFDKNRPQVSIEQNVPLLGLGLLVSMIDTLNDSTLWGLPARCIKLSSISWERKFQGQCYVYYTRSLDFEINYRIDPLTGALASGFDRVVLDEGTKVLRGDWQRDPASQFYKQYQVASDLDTDVDGTGPGTAYTLGTAHLNPVNFVRFKDWNGENAKVILNGRGRPYDPGSTSAETGTGSDTTVGSIRIEKYTESNFLLLGIPTTF